MKYTLVSNIHDNGTHYIQVPEDAYPYMVDLELEKTWKPFSRFLWQCLLCNNIYNYKNYQGGECRNCTLTTS